MMQALLLIFSLSIDSFVAGFSMGESRIKLSMNRVLLLSGIGIISLVISTCLGGCLEHIITSRAVKFYSALLFIILGTGKILESLIHTLSRKEKEIKIRFSQIEFIFHIYAYPEASDIDGSQNLSLVESIWLGLALSLDNLAIGIGIGLLQISLIFIAVAGFCTNVLLMIFGYDIGKILTLKWKWNLSWLSGVLLFLLAFFV